MNVLEKILEEIKERIEKLNMADNMCRENAERNRNFEGVKYFQSLMFATERAESIIGDIIRSHMDEVNDTNVPSNWIPVEERLPEEGKEVLAQFVVRVRYTNGKVDEAVYIYPLHYEEGKWKSFHGMPNGKVEAWQPLPEPYKGGKENE